MKVQGKIFKLCAGHFCARLLLHDVICITKCKPSVKLFLSFFLSSPGHFSVNDLFTVSKQLAITFQRNFTCVSRVDDDVTESLTRKEGQTPDAKHIHATLKNIAVQNFIDLMVDLDLSRSQLYKITFWVISQFLLDKLLPNFNTG